MEPRRTGTCTLLPVLYGCVYTYLPHWEEATLDDLRPYWSSDDNHV